MFDLMITGGTVVLPNEAALVDVGIQDGRIAAIAAPGTLNPMMRRRTLDASGRIVTPGGIEPHIPRGGPTCRRAPINWWPVFPMAGPLEHSLGAIWGGTTTVVDFAPAPREGDLVGGVHDFLGVWNDNAYTDYSAQHHIFQP